MCSECCVPVSCLLAVFCLALYSAVTFSGQLCLDCIVDCLVEACSRLFEVEQLCGCRSVLVSPVSHVFCQQVIAKHAHYFDMSEFNRI